MDENEKNYIVYSPRKENGKGAFYFWSGDCFTGDISKAKIHPCYADCIDTIWRGILWDQNAQLEKLGFSVLRAIPLIVAEKEIKLEWRGKETLSIHEKRKK